MITKQLSRIFASIVAIYLCKSPSATQCKGFQISPVATRSSRSGSPWYEDDVGGRGRNSSRRTQEGDGADASSSSVGPDRIYLDVAIGDAAEPVGRLVFAGLREARLYLPSHTDNLVQLCDGSARSVDPRCSYVGCRFRHSPNSVEGLPQYRWAHTLDGRGRNASGRGGDRLPADLGGRHAHRVYGGSYYGLEYNDNNNDDGVLLTVPLTGAQRGSTGFSVVRVGESPREWRERLLLNSAVLGVLESGSDVLRALARQTDGPPTVVASGTLP